MLNSLSRIKTLMVRNLKEIIRDPVSLSFTLGLPLVLEILFYCIFHSLSPQFEMRYLAPGIVAFSQTFLCLFIGLLIANDRSSSFFARLYVSRVKASEFIISYILAVLPICLVQSSMFFVVGGIFDVSLFQVEMIYAIFLSLISAFLFLSIGVLIGCLTNERSVGALSSIVINAHSILSGMWFPNEGLDGVLLNVMNYLPFMNANKLLQNTLNGIPDIIFPLANVAFYGAIFFGIAAFCFKNKMKLK